MVLVPLMELLRREEALVVKINEDPNEPSNAIKAELRGVRTEIAKYLTRCEGVYLY